jgi:ribose transport system substrate-binding protein
MRITALVSALGLVLIAAGCGGSRHQSTEKYYLVAANIKVPYWQSAQSGLVRAARQLGVQAEMVGPETYDVKGEKEAFAAAVAKKPTGILVSAADPNALKPEIDAAIAQGIPVIAIDADAPASKRIAFIGTNNYQAGLAGGKILAKRLAGKGTVVVFTMPGQLNLEDRLNGYRDAIGSSPGIKIDQVVDFKGDPRIAFDTATEMISKKAQVDAFVCLEAIACKEVAEVLNRNKITGKTIIAMDTDAETLEWIQKGIIAATISQKPFTMAYYGLIMLDGLHHNPPPSLDHHWAQDSFAPVPAFVDTGSSVIDPSNVAAFLSARDASAK